jgi:valyl-tRNA synthetase
MENIRDWNISRQLWWGHRIPAWYAPDGSIHVALTAEEALSIVRKTTGNANLQLSDLRQDEDCLDTWFSSWLWPMTVFDGINNPDNADIQYYYPTSDLVTGPDIIFFWVARMIMAGYEYRRQECFRNVYFTGIVRDKQGRKMSKSLGNSPDPIELMDKYGADGVRFGILLSAPAGNDIHFDEALCEQGRNFCNKIWNALRLIKGWQTAATPTPDENAAAMDWFAALLARTIVQAEDLFAKFRLSEALMLIYKLYWDEFSAWYLELIKPAYGKPIDQRTYDTTIVYFESMLKLLHPFMPFITEELYHALTQRAVGDSIMVQSVENIGGGIGGGVRYEIVDEFDTAKAIITGIRNIRASKNISPKEKLILQVNGSHNAHLDGIIKKLANIECIENVGGSSRGAQKMVGAVSFLVGTTEYYLLVDMPANTDEDRSKLEAELAYFRKFLANVEAKLANEKFAANAPKDVVALERKKQADAESKIRGLEEQLKMRQD